MKVICRKCSDLVPEDEAIKISMEDYKTLKGFYERVPFVATSAIDSNTYTQICEKCYLSMKGR